MRIFQTAFAPPFSNTFDKSGIVCLYLDLSGRFSPGAVRVGMAQSYHGYPSAVSPTGRDS